MFAFVAVKRKGSLRLIKIRIFSNHIGLKWKLVRFTADNLAEARLLSFAMFWITWNGLMWSALLIFFIISVFLSDGKSSPFIHRKCILNIFLHFVNDLRLQETEASCWESMEAERLRCFCASGCSGLSIHRSKDKHNKQSHIHFFQMIVFLLAVLVFPSSHAFPDHVPTTVCVEMHPHHNNNHSQPLASSPYSITVSSANYTPGSQVTVNITGSMYFKGFMLQARSEGKPDYPVGSFQDPMPLYTGHLWCSGGEPKVKIRSVLISNSRCHCCS